MATVTWEAPSSFSNVLTTELDSLADAAACTASSAIDNSTNLDIFADLSLILGSSNPSGSPYWEVHLLPRLGDGSTYADRNASTLVATIAVDTGSSTKEGMARGIIIPPGHYKWQLVNRTGVANAASGNTASVRTYGETVA